MASRGDEQVADLFVRRLGEGFVVTADGVKFRVYPHDLYWISHTLQTFNSMRGSNRGGNDNASCAQPPGGADGCFGRGPGG